MLFYNEAVRFMKQHEKLFVGWNLLKVGIQHPERIERIELPYDHFSSEFIKYINEALFLEFDADRKVVSVYRMRDLNE